MLIITLSLLNIKKGYLNEHLRSSCGIKVLFYVLLGSSGLFEISWSHNISAAGEIGQEFEAQMDELRREEEERARIEAEQSAKLIAEMMKNEPELDPSLTVT